VSEDCFSHLPIFPGCNMSITHHRDFKLTDEERRTLMTSCVSDVRPASLFSTSRCRAVSRRSCQRSHLIVFWQLADTAME